MRGRKPELTNEQVADLVSRYNAGERPVDLAKMFKCSATQIHRIIRKNRTIEPLTTELDLDVQNAHDRALYEWFKAYAVEIGCNTRQLMRLLMIREKARAERGE